MKKKNRKKAFIHKRKLEKKAREKELLLKNKKTVASGRSNSQTQISRDIVQAAYKRLNKRIEQEKKDFSSIDSVLSNNNLVNDKIKQYFLTDKHIISHIKNLVNKKQTLLNQRYNGNVIVHEVPYLTNKVFIQYAKLMDEWYKTTNKSDKTDIGLSYHKMCQQLGYNIHEFEEETLCDLLSSETGSMDNNHAQYLFVVTKTYIITSFSDISYDYHNSFQQTLIYGV